MTNPALPATWRTPLVILICGCLIGIIGFGARSGLGFFLTPISSAHGWGRDVFALALAIQMLLWGAAQPFAGGLADRYGPVLVLSVGTVIYAAGLVGMVYSSTPAAMYITAGVILGFGVAGSGFTIVMASFGKLLPERWRSLAFGLGTAAGSLGQFLFSPLSVVMINSIGWQNTLLVFAAMTLLMAPLSLALMTPRGASSAPAPGPFGNQTVKQAIAEAFGHRSYVLLMLGYFTCGFQIFFISVHLPSFLIDRGLSSEVGGWTLAMIGLFNVIGALSAGMLGTIMPKRFLLSAIYFARSVAIGVYMMLPPTTVTTLTFGAVMGLLWLSTIPPTSSLIALMFGTRWLAMLLGVAYFSHQVGGFLGVWLGGLLFERTGSYDIVWLLTIALGIFSAIVNLPIVEKPVERAVPAPA